MMATTESLPVGKEVTTPLGGKTAGADAGVFAATFAAVKGDVAGKHGTAVQLVPAVKGQRELAGWGGGPGRELPVVAVAVAEGLRAGMGARTNAPGLVDVAAPVSSLMGKQEIMETAPDGGGSAGVQQAVSGTGVQPAVWTRDGAQVAGSKAVADELVPARGMAGMSSHVEARGVQDGITTNGHASEAPAAAVSTRELSSGAEHAVEVAVVMPVALGVSAAVVKITAGAAAAVVGDTSAVSSRRGEGAGLDFVGLGSVEAGAASQAGQVAASLLAATSHTQVPAEAVVRQRVGGTVQHGGTGDLGKDGGAGVQAVAGAEEKGESAGATRRKDKTAGESHAVPPGRVVDQAAVPASGNVTAQGIDGTIVAANGMPTVGPSLVGGSKASSEDAARLVPAAGESTSGGEIVRSAPFVAAGPELTSVGVGRIERDANGSSVSPLTVAGAGTVRAGRFSGLGGSAVGATSKRAEAAKVAKVQVESVDGEKLVPTVPVAAPNGTGESIAMPVRIGVTPVVATTVAGPEPVVHGVAAVGAPSGANVQVEAPAAKGKDAKAAGAVHRSEGPHAVAVGVADGKAAGLAGTNDVVAAAKSSIEQNKISEVSGVAAVAPASGSNAHASLAVGWTGVVTAPAAAVAPVSSGAGMPLDAATVRSKAEGDGLSVASGLAAGPTGEATSGLATGLGASGQGHTTLQATPTVLEIGVPGGTHGWMKIRAEMGEGGAVQASVSSATQAGQETLRRELPAMSAYLQSEHVPVSLQMAHSVAAAASTASSGLGGGDALAVGAGAGGQAGANAEQNRGDGASGGVSAGSADAGSGPQHGTEDGVAGTGLGDAVSAAVTSAEQDWSSPAGYGGVGLGGGGNWVNVIA